MRPKKLKWGGRWEDPNYINARLQEGGLISKLGYMDHSPFKSNPFLDIQSNNGSITMQNVSTPLLGVDNLGTIQTMLPNKEYGFPGKTITEMPLEKNGGLIKRADGSYSKHGLWDSIRENKGSGKKPSSKMLQQEKKLNKQQGGVAPSYDMPNAYLFDMWHPNFYPEHKDSVSYKNMFNNVSRNPNNYNPQTYYNEADRVKNNRSAYDAVNGLDAARGNYLNNMLLGNAIKDAQSIPIRKNPFMQEGGISKQNHDFLFGDDDKLDGTIDFKASGNLDVSKPLIPLNQSVSKMQKGGVPIITNNPNDSRLKAYNDSLGIYNQSETLYNSIKKSGKAKDLDVSLPSEKKIPYKEFIDNYTGGSDHFGIINNGTNKYMYPQEVAHFKGNGFFGFLDYAEQARYKKPEQEIVYQQQSNIQPKPITNKPVQPIIYQKEEVRNLFDPGQTIPTPINLGNPYTPNNIQYKQLDLTPAQLKTNYSATYRDENSATKDNTKYFNNVEDWNNFVNSSEYNFTNKTQTNNSAQAAGYLSKGNTLKFQIGGSAKSNYDFLFGDDDKLDMEDDLEDALAVKSPSTEEIGKMQKERTEFNKEKQDWTNQKQYDEAMQAAMSNEGENEGENENDNLYSGVFTPITNKNSISQTFPNLSSSTAPNFSSKGNFGMQNISPLGVQMGNAIADALGYKPTFNSIYRDEKLNTSVGGVPNSQHLKATAIDVTPSDWNNIPKEKQQELKSKFTIINEGNHIHSQLKKQMGGIMYSPGQTINNLNYDDVIRLKKQGYKFSFLD